MEIVKQLVESNNFGDRWPSSGLISIFYMLQRENLSKVFLHGFLHMLLLLFWATRFPSLIA